MYQVVINNKYYVSDVSGEEMNCVIIYNIEQEHFFYSHIDNITLTANKCGAKFFSNKIEAQEVAKEIDGKVIEYIRKSE